MKRFLSRVSPRRAIGDLLTVWNQPNEHRWPVLGVAIAATFAIFVLFIPKAQRIEPARPEIIYISTFDETRSEAEIIASNCANQRLKDQLAALLEERAELRRDLYRALGRATFLDVEEMERQIEAERAAEAEAAARQERPIPEVALSLDEYCRRAAG